MHHSVLTVQMALYGVIEGYIDMANILIVDDSDLVRDLLRCILEEAGHEVMEAVNGKKAVKFHQKKPADLIITDINMPGKNGLELIVELRKQDPELKVIAMSGDSTEDLSESLQAAQKLGAAYAFSKPFDPMLLLAAVQKLLA